MFTRYGFTIPDDAFNYENLLKNDKKTPSNIITDKITFDNLLYKYTIPDRIINNKASNQKDMKTFILSNEYTNNINSNIIPCNNDNCLTRDIFNIMCLCCSLTYYLINQSRVNIFDYFYTTNLIEELCIYYTLKSEIKVYQTINKEIEDIISLYYQIMNRIQNMYSSDSTDTKINKFVKNNLFCFLNTNLNSFLNDKEDINKNNECDKPNKPNKDEKIILELIERLKILLNNLKKNYKDNLNIFITKTKIQKINYNNYINYFNSAYEIIKKIIINNDFDNIYLNIYKYDYTHIYNDVNIYDLIKLRTYLLLMFMYKLRFISFNDVDDKGGRQAEFFISHVLRDFYNYYYIDKNNIINGAIKEKYTELLTELLQYNFYNNKEIITLPNNNYIAIYAYDNIITLEYKNGNILERFRPFEKMLNINECSNNKIGGKNGDIGGDLIYLHELYELPESSELENDEVTSSSICIIVDSKAYQDSSFITEHKIDKTIIQCYLYAQYIKKCYTKNIYYNDNNDNNLYLSVVNPVYGSYYVYKYKEVEEWLNNTSINIDKQERKPKLNEYLKENYKLFNVNSSIEVDQHDLPENSSMEIEKTNSHVKSFNLNEDNRLAKINDTDNLNSIEQIKDDNDQIDRKRRRRQ